jgi:hypothetical protein
MVQKLSPCSGNVSFYIIKITISFIAHTSMQHPSRGMNPGLEEHQQEPGVTVNKHVPQQSITINHMLCPYQYSCSEKGWCALTRMGTAPGSVYGQKGTMKDILARCLKKTNVQVCTLFNVCVMRYPHPCYICTNRCFLPCASVSVYSQVFIFRRFQINHEPHEFILDPGTVANS